ncbi:MAG: cytoskeletal protein CcmA (bactofilin family) [Burkholderiaceae bacterium]|jgi:cytoskeletal protein CcmA (bactofilin family)
MNSTFALYLFCVLCLAILTLPFIPAVSEWRVPKDCSPLPISLEYASEIDYFTRQFRNDALTDIAAERSESKFDYVDGPPEQMKWMDGTRPLIGLDAVCSDTPVRCNRPLYLHGDFDCGINSSLTSVLTHGMLRLGANGEILEWGHADGPIRLGKGCVSLRRLSSVVSIELANRCCFERLSAPVIHLGLRTTEIRITPKLANHLPASLNDLPGAIRRTDALTLVKGDCRLADGTIYTGSLIVTGNLTIGHHTIVDGNVKARNAVQVGRFAQITGSLICEDHIELHDHVSVAGPLISETDIVLGSGAKIGRIDAPTTISADNLIAQSGAIVHGTIWARKAGVVWEP